MEEAVKTKKKSIFKRWWFWVIIAVVGIIIVGSASSSEPLESNEQGNTNGTQVETLKTDTNNNNESSNNESNTQYQEVDLQSMIDDLKNNALRAEAKYQNAYVEFTGKIASFDSDGAYITVEPINADAWNFDTVMCYIKNTDQKNFLLEKSVGDQVTIKGKIFSIGEVLGYSLNIDSVS